MLPDQTPAQQTNITSRKLDVERRGQSQTQHLALLGMGNKKGPDLVIPVDLGELQIIHGVVG